MRANRVAENYLVADSRSSYRAATRFGAGLIILASSLTAAGCSVEPIAGNAARTSASTLAGPSGESLPSSECSAPEIVETYYGVHWGISPDITPKLLGDQGAEVQAAEWEKFSAEVHQLLDSQEGTPLDITYVVDAGVGYADQSKDWADQKATELAKLAIDQLSMAPSQAYPNEGYHGQDYVATLHIRGIVAGSSGECNALPYDIA